MNPVVKIQRQFFSNTKVIREIDRKTAKVLGRFGGTVRKIAQRSMKDRKEVSPPGKPPHAHKKKLLKRLYFYSYNRTNKSVVVGPVLFAKYRDKKIPRALERGGVIFKTLRKSGRVIPMKYRPRPYTLPAARIVLPMIGLWYKQL